MSRATILSAVLVLLVVACPARADLWSYFEGTVMTNWSSTKSDVRNMFGGSFGPAFECGCEGSNTLFSDGLPAGTVHFVEWQTPVAITLRSFSLMANHDGLPADASLRGFSRFRLFAEDPDTGEFDIGLYDISPTDPYGDTPEPLYTYIDRNPGFAHPSICLVLTANVLETTAQRFRAEFVQFGLGNSYASGPRILELDGFDTYYPGRPYPVSETQPGDLNGDWFVGGAELDIVRSFWGQTVPRGSLLHGDVSGNGVCSRQDMDIVRAHWGARGIPPAPAAIPEPAAIALLLGTILPACLFRWRRRPGNGSLVCS